MFMAQLFGDLVDFREALTICASTVNMFMLTTALLRKIIMQVEAKESLLYAKVQYTCGWYSFLYIIDLLIHFGRRKGCASVLRT